ncbi:ABC transporter permease [Azotobacter vinelandii]
MLGLPWAVLLALWTAVPHLSERYAALVPSPASVLRHALPMLADGSLFVHWAASASRVIGGVLLGGAGGGAGGFRARLVRRRPAAADAAPELFFRALPPIALIPLTIVYFGIGEAAKILVLVYAAFFTAVVVLYEGISRIAPIYVNVARTLGASERELFLRVVLPLALPHVLTATRVALGVGWMTLVASELVSAQNGLGSMIQVAASYFQLEVIYLGLICIGFTAMAMDFLLVRLSARLVGWQERVK